MYFEFMRFGVNLLNRVLYVAGVPKRGAGSASLVLIWLDKSLTTLTRVFKVDSLFSVLLCVESVSDGVGSVWFVDGWLSEIAGVARPVVVVGCVSSGSFDFDLVDIFRFYDSRNWEYFRIAGFFRCLVGYFLETGYFFLYLGWETELSRFERAFIIRHEGCGVFWWCFNVFIFLVFCLDWVDF